MWLDQRLAASRASVTRQFFIKDTCRAADLWAVHPKPPVRRRERGSLCRQVAQAQLDPHPRADVHVHLAFEMLNRVQADGTAVPVGAQVRLAATGASFTVASRGEA